ncbi:glycosyltransferase 87 family protein [Streptomyces sp. NPDC097617]|uniref:glycosyltransferase 87 family protein n=1 Tax=Streptomyces sp. NPDC097617 TaxID=3366091 RepID=UPI0037F2A6BF
MKPRTAPADRPAAPAAASAAAGPAALTAATLAVLTAALVLTVRHDGYFTDAAGLFSRYAACWALFALALLALRRVPAAHVLPLLVAGALAVTLTGLVAPPRTSTDSYRYAWDGRVQSAGISPYDHAPQDPAVARLRDPWLFPTGAACAGPDRAAVPGGPVPHCTRINRPAVHTIYPPVAEVYFLAVDRLSPEGARHKPLQIGAGLLSLGVTGALLLILRRRGRDLRRAAYWAWCPAVPIEAVNNAHVDVLGVLLAVTGLGLVAARGTGRRAAGGLVLGAAIATKLMPAVVMPGALSGVRRIRDAAAVLVPATAFVLLAYLPYVLLSHSSVLGYLGGYVDEEGYDDPSAGSRYALLRLVLPDSWALPVLLVAMTCVSLYVMWRGDPRRPWSGALLVTGWAFVLLTPGYSWYALLLIALVGLDGRWEWLGPALAGAAVYLLAPVLGHRSALSAIAYGAAVLLVLAVAAIRRRCGARSGPPGGRDDGPPRPV